MSRRGANLSALTNVEATTRGWRAFEGEPWLRCEVPPSAGRWVRLEYASGLLDDVVRPVLRLVGRREIRDEFLPAAMLGRAVWIGQLPEDLREVWISPSLTPGPFSFRIERWETLSAVQALTQFGPYGFSRAAKYMWGRYRGWERFARLQARRALGATPLAEYGEWRLARLRPFDPVFDAVEPTNRPPAFHIVAADADAAAALKATLTRQTWPHWTLGLADRLSEIDDETYVTPLDAGDRLEPYALAVLAAKVSQADGLDALYADEDMAVGAARALPRFKPDWSPLFYRSGYAGVPLAIRGAAFKNGGFDPDTAKVAHARRVLVSRRAPSAVAKPGREPAPEYRRQVSVIVPTRDRLDLLQPCLESLTKVPSGADLELIVLDNGSERETTIEYLNRLDQSPDARVLHCPGAFNFSAMCNLGARTARHPYLLFLNNDVEALTPGWLARMLVFAAEPRVGAVGAKLVYPDGRLQHGGVVLGLDGFAGHVQRAVAADDPGYLGMLAWPREVAAVTGACLAVEARKFFEIGGFDEERLPIEYNDIDLCLRLAERGYVSVFEPRAELMHRESATRGPNPFLDSRYANEHNYFRERWGARLRDDPYFHPALSLDALEIALG